VGSRPCRLQPRWWMSSDPLAAPSGGPPSISSSSLVVDAARLAGSVPQGGRHRRLLQPQWWTLPDPPAAPRHRCLLQPRWSTLLDPPTMPPRGPTIDVIFNLNGGRYRTHRQRPQGVPPLTYSTSVVDAAGPTGSAPQGARHQRRLQPRWWTMLDLPAAPPRGPAIDVYFNCHRRLATSGSHYQYLLPTSPMGPLVNY
jgi:hypothetical protein